MRTIGVASSAKSRWPTLIVGDLRQAGIEIERSFQA